jgi:holo-[acyl-carrier protein] synthase
MIIGHGIDIVEVARVEQMVKDHGDRFLNRCFTAHEQAYCGRQSKRLFEHLAGRFAAKEAVLKALGTGWRGGIAWTDVEVLNEASGAPLVRLSGECRRVAESRNVSRWLISISHISTYAAASAIALRS